MNVRAPRSERAGRHHGYAARLNAADLAMARISTDDDSAYFL